MSCTLQICISTPAPKYKYGARDFLVLATRLFRIFALLMMSAPSKTDKLLTTLRLNLLGVASHARNSSVTEGVKPMYKVIFSTLETDALALKNEIDMLIAQQSSINDIEDAVRRVEQTFSDDNLSLIGKLVKEDDGGTSIEVFDALTADKMNAEFLGLSINLTRQTLARLRASDPQFQAESCSTGGGHTQTAQEG